MFRGLDRQRLSLPWPVTGFKAKPEDKLRGLAPNCPKLSIVVVVETRRPLSVIHFMYTRLYSLTSLTSRKPRQGLQGLDGQGLINLHKLPGPELPQYVCKSADPVGMGSVLSWTARIRIWVPSAHLGSLSNHHVFLLSSSELYAVTCK
jgi:hypothetical protein